VGLHEFFPVLKYLYPDIYNDLKSKLTQDETYLEFCNSKLNLKALMDSYYLVDMYEGESLANFYTINLDTEKIPYAFFNKLNYKDYLVNLPTKPFNQQIYFDILWDVIEKIELCIGNL